MGNEKTLNQLFQDRAEKDKPVLTNVDQNAKEFTKVRSTTYNNLRKAVSLTMRDVSKKADLFNKSDDLVDKKNKIAEKKRAHQKIK